MATPEQEFQRGRNAIVYWNNVMVREMKYPYTVNETIQIIQSRQGAKNFVQGLGMGIILGAEDGTITESQVRSGMEALARKGNGKIPANNGAFTQAVANGVQENISWVNATLYTGKETVKDIATGTAKVAQTIGDTTIGMGKFTLFVIEYWWVSIPVVLGGYVYFQMKLAKNFR